MNDLTMLRDFRAEFDDGDPRARAAAREELEGKLERATEPQAHTHRSPRRSLVALAGIGAVAAATAAVLILSSGPTAPPAAAQVLHETAAVAAAGDGASALDASPGQYYFTKLKELQLTGWYPGSYEIPGAPTSRPGGFTALVPSEVQLWGSPEGGSRTRTTLGELGFVTSAEEKRWEAAGSPLPSNFDPSRQAEINLGEVPDTRIIEVGAGVIDTERLQPREGPASVLYPDLSGNPTDPRALRLAIEHHQAPGISDEPGTPLDPQETIADLTGILYHPNASAALRAAAFNALAEMPGVTLNRGATDLTGRGGYSISFGSTQKGLRDEYIFDPETSQLLGERTVLVDPGAEPAIWKGYEAGLTTRDVAYLGAKVVDSTREPAK